MFIVLCYCESKHKVLCTNHGHSVNFNCISCCDMPSCSDWNVFFHSHFSHLFRVKVNYRKIEASEWPKQIVIWLQLAQRREQKIPRGSKAFPRHSRDGCWTGNHTIACRNALAMGYLQRKLGLIWIHSVLGISTVLNLVQFGPQQISLLMGGLWIRKKSRFLFR